MSGKAGPSKRSSHSSRSASPQKKSAMIVDEASEHDSDSDSSVDSDDIDEPVVQTPRQTPKAGRNAAALPRYQAPIGMEPVSVSASFKNSPFEFDALNKKGVELWAIRVPADFKASRLSSLALDRPGKNVRGRLERSGGSYALQAAEEGEGIGAEMGGMSLLVPNMRAGGKLQRAPVKISRRLILAPTDDKAAGTAYTAPPKAKRTQPEGKLKFRNRAFGFDTPGPGATAREAKAETEQADATEAGATQVSDDKEEAEPETPAKSKSPKKEKKDKKDKKGKEGKKDKKEGKKRKAEDETPKKKKKAKVE